MIDTSGMITVAEAAKRLNLSIEQVRRKLREGKLRGQRIGNQWLVDERVCVKNRDDKDRIIPRKTMESVARIREEIARRNPGYEFDAVKLVREARDSH